MTFQIFFGKAKRHWRFFACSKHTVKSTATASLSSSASIDNSISVRYNGSFPSCLNSHLQQWLFPLLSQSHSHHGTCTLQDRAVPAAGHPGQGRQHRPRARPHRGRRGRRRQARRSAGKDPFAMETLPSYAEDIDGGGSPSVSMLSEVAASRKITIIGGSIPEKASGQLFNTCCVIGPEGAILGKHRKLHLFGINIPGDICFRESDTFTAGQEPTVVDTDVGRIGIGICHDIRFPELAMLYRARGAHLVCYPSAFNMSTGQLLWDLMQKSRAIDNQFGEVLAAAGHEEATVVGEIDLSLIEAVRENIPLEMQRRGDLYRLVDVQKEYYAS